MDYSSSVIIGWLYIEEQSSIMFPYGFSSDKKKQTSEKEFVSKEFEIIASCERIFQSKLAQGDISSYFHEKTV